MTGGYLNRPAANHDGYNTLLSHSDRPKFTEPPLARIALTTHGFDCARHSLRSRQSTIKPLRFGELARVCTARLDY